MQNTIVVVRTLVALGFAFETKPFKQIFISIILRKNQKDPEIPPHIVV